MLSDRHAQVHLKVGEEIVRAQSSEYFNNKTPILLQVEEHCKTKTK